MPHSSEPAGSQDNDLPGLAEKTGIDSTTSLDRLARNLGVTWSNLDQARELAGITRRKLTEALSDVVSDDVSIVVSGSLARGEFTSGSDIDWTLLVDGLSDAKHLDLTIEIGKTIQALAPKEVGQEKTFGTMVFSHDLVHQIGGEDDTNKNLTRRLLLLLESRAIGRDAAYRRVVRNILNRYLLEDRGFWGGSGHRVPRFLQNDFARYWRTMAVDFAFKLRTRSGRGWAIRNMKLRMSRKLIYVSGLLACYRCHLDYTPDERLTLFKDKTRREEVIEHLEQVFSATPLEIVASVLLRNPQLNESALKILGSYDEFVGILSAKENRDDLEALTEQAAETNELYQHVRHLSHTFRDGLLEFFFDSESEMESLTKNYGVF